MRPSNSYSEMSYLNGAVYLLFGMAATFFNVVGCFAPLSAFSEANAGKVGALVQAGHWNSLLDSWILPGLKCKWDDWRDDWEDWDDLDGGLILPPARTTLRRGRRGAPAE